MSEVFATAGSQNYPERWRTLHHFAYIDRPFRDVRRYLAAGPQRIAAESAKARLAGLDLNRDIRMVLGDLQVGVHSARLPIHWEDGRHPGLFPLLDATLEFVPVAAGRRPTTQVGLFGHYQPPLGHLGALGDTLAGNRVVLESVEGFLEDVTVHLERAIPPVAPEPSRDDGHPGLPAGRHRVILPVDEIKRWPGGAAGMTLRLEGQPGVHTATINPHSGLAIIEYDAARCSVNQLLRLLGPHADEA